MGIVIDLEKERQKRKVSNIVTEPNFGHSIANDVLGAHQYICENLNNFQYIPIEDLTDET